MKRLEVIQNPDGTYTATGTWEDIHTWMRTVSTEQYIQYLTEKVADLQLCSDNAMSDAAKWEQEAKSKDMLIDKADLMYVSLKYIRRVLAGELKLTPVDLMNLDSIISMWEDKIHP